MVASFILGGLAHKHMRVHTHTHSHLELCSHATEKVVVAPGQASDAQLLQWGCPLWLPLRI